jgi:flagellar biosynthetic protein FliR
MLTISSVDWNNWISLFLYPFVRILSWLMADPLLGNKAVPTQVRVGLALVMAVLVAPSMPVTPQVALVSGEGLVLLAWQIAVGVALGFTVRIVFAAVELAGQFLGLQMGLSFAALFDPVNGAQTPVLGQLLSIVTVLLLFAFNGHHLIIAALWDGFQTVPLIPGAMSAKGFTILVEWGGAIFITGLHLALPVAAALLTANLTIGMMTRAAPQLNVFAIGFPISIGVGFAVLYLSMAYLPAFMEGFLRRAVDVGAAAMRGLAP